MASLPTALTSILVNGLTVLLFLQGLAQRLLSLPWLQELSPDCFSHIWATHSSVYSSLPPAGVAVSTAGSSTARKRPFTSSIVRVDTSISVLMKSAIWVYLVGMRADTWRLLPHCR